MSKLSTRDTLTPRQQQILDLIVQSVGTTGAPPTRAEIAKAFGFSSPNAAESHLQALARKGAIELVGGTSRGIRLPEEVLQRSLDRRVHGSAREQVPPSAQPLVRESLHHERPDWLPTHEGLETLSLPLVGRVAAGFPILAAEHIEAHFPVSPALFVQRPDYLLKVCGMSMRDVGIWDGDLLAVRKQSEARAGQIVVARVGDEVTVKRYQPGKGRVELLPENAEFEPIIVDLKREEFAIEGLAVGLIRQNGAF